MSLKRLTILNLILVIFISIYGCKKTEQIDAPESIPPIKIPPIITSLKVDSVEQLSFVITYQLAIMTNATGICYSTDSASLVSNSQSEWPSALYNGAYYAKPRFFSHPSKSKFWFKIYYQNASGDKIYSQIYSQDLPSYLIKNKYIVNGKGEYNNHPKDFFINYEKTPIGAFDNSLIVVAYNNDLNVQNYSATLNGISTSIGRIDPIAIGNNQKSIIVDVPNDIANGDAKFNLYYLSKLVYSTDVTIVNGGLLTKTKHPGNFASWRACNAYGGKIYTFNYTYASTLEGQFYQLTPETNTWLKLPNPDAGFQPSNGPAAGINGVLYFPPICIRSLINYIGFDTYYDEIIWTYNLNTKIWSKINLFHTADQTKDRNMVVMESFAYKDKLYCITQESIGARYGEIKMVLRVFDPVSNSWDLVMDLPYTAWSFKVVVQDNRIFMLTATTGTQASATTEFENQFLELNLDTKQLINKNWITDKKVGVAKTYLASHKGKIYAYGGQYSIGYVSLYSSFFAVYDPSTDKWAPVSNYSYYTAWVSQTNGLFLSVNDKLYVGLGYDRYTNGDINGSKINDYIYSLSIK